VTGSMTVPNCLMKPTLASTPPIISAVTRQLTRQRVLEAVHQDAKHADAAEKACSPEPLQRLKPGQPDQGRIAGERLLILVVENLSGRLDKRNVLGVCSCECRHLESCSCYGSATRADWYIYANRPSATGLSCSISAE
jgi:hypothetical protein